MLDAEVHAAQRAVEADHLEAETIHAKGFKKNWIQRWLKVER